MARTISSRVSASKSRIELKDSVASTKAVTVVIRKSRIELKAENGGNDHSEGPKGCKSRIELKGMTAAA